MKTRPHALALSAVLLITAFPLLTGCGFRPRIPFLSRSTPDEAPREVIATRSWEAEAAKLGIPEQDLARIASEAVRRHGGTPIEIKYQDSRDKNTLVVFLAPKPSSRSGKMAVFRNTNSGWKEEVGAAAVWSE